MKIHEYNQMMKWLTRKPNTERTGLAKGTKPDTKPKTENSKMLQYINDVQIVYGDKKASKEETEAAIKRVEATPKKMSYQDEYKMLYGKEPKKVAKKIPVIPPKPDLINGHSDWNTEDWLESIDPGGWVDDKKVGILEQDLANEYWQEQFENYQNNGGTLNYQQFMQLQLQQKVSNEINKRVKDKQRTEGIAQILSLPSKI